MTNAFTLPPDTRSVGSGNPPQDMNAVVDALTALGAMMNALNAANAGGADNTGGADVGNAINAASARGVALIPPGTFKLSSSVVLTGPVRGAGIGLTTFQVASGFTGTAAISLTTDYAEVSDVAIVGASSTISSNPVCNGIEVTGAAHVKVRDVFFQYINGYAFESVGGASKANVDMMVTRLIARNCAGGVHDKGVTGSSFGGEHFYSDIQLQQIGAGSGGSANLDAFFIEDVADIQLDKINGAVSDLSTGSTLHIKGACSSIFVNNFDLGVFPNTSPANSVLKIEDSTNGSPGGVHFDTGILQAGLAGATISGAASRVYFNGTDFANNYGHGCVLSGSGSQIYFGADTTFRGNGTQASGTNYDLNISGTAIGYVRGCHFQSPIVSTGTAGVQAAVNITGGQNVPFEDTDFTGTNATVGNIFTNLPTWVRNCRGYNPHGSVTQTVPASGTAVSALHYDAIYYITAGTGGCTLVRNTNGFGGGTGPTVTIPAAACVPVLIRAGGTFTPTYTNAPTWTVDGQ